MYSVKPPERVPGVWYCSASLVLCLICLAAGGHAEPLLFDPLSGARAAGELPPEMRATTATPLHPSLELPGGNLWLRGEVPSGAADPTGALRDASATLGVRMPYSLGDGIGLETKPTLNGSASAATHPGASALSPGFGFALAQTVSLRLPFGLRFGAEGSVGDRMGIFGPAAAAPAIGSSSLMMRTGATLSTDFALPFIEARISLGLGVTATGPLGRRSDGANYLYEPSECKLSFDIGKVGSAPLWVSAPCPKYGLPGAPISFGFKTEF